MSGKYNSNTSTMNSQQVTLDSLVFDYYRYAIDAILKDRKSKMNPIISSSQLVTQVQPPASFAAQTIDHVGYISNTLQGWKKSLTKPMTLDIYLYHSQLNQHILIERWSFSYQANNDFSNKSSSTGGTSSSSSSSSNSNRLVAIVNRRIQTFVRSLYCFVRLLPGFNLLQLSRIEPFMHFQIYESRMSPSNFFYEVSKHHFPPIATTKGKLTTSLQFIDSIHVMEIIKTINGGALIGAGPALSSSPEVAKTASSPIPISGNAAPRARTHTADDPYKRSFHRPTELPLMETGPHARSYESNVPETVARMNSHPIRIPGSQRHRDSFEGDPMYSNPTGYSFGSTPPVSSYSQNTPPFAHYPMNQNDDGSSDGNSVEMAGPSPPYSQYSSSLNSTSPHGTNLALVDRRNSFRRSQISSSFGRPTSINFYDYDKLRTKITLPASPFILPHQNSASSSSTQVTTIATGTPNTAGDAIITHQQRQQQRTRSKEDSNKLDFVLQFEREKERQISGIYVDVLDRSRSISGITRDEELEKLTDLFGSNHPNQQPLSDHQNNVDDEEMPFAVPPAASNDIASSIFGYGRPVHSSSMSEANTYYSLTAVSGELMSKLNEFKEFRSNISLL